jgi:hypothetical protein
VGDPRYERSTAGDATEPDNATSGMVGGAWSWFGLYHYEVLVSDEESRHRFWRGTPYQNGGTALIGAPNNLNVIADEWNRDGDNGFRPPGLVFLSSTPTVGNTITMGQPEIAARSRYTTQVTHHMIMLRVPTSQAITFHAGTTDSGNALSEPAPCTGGDPHLEALQRGVGGASSGLHRCSFWRCPDPFLAASSWPWETAGSERSRRAIRRRRARRISNAARRAGRSSPRRCRRTGCHDSMSRPSRAPVNAHAH